MSEQYKNPIAPRRASKNGAYYLCAEIDPEIDLLQQENEELKQALKMSKCKSDTVEIAEIYVSEGESVISGTPIFKDTDGKVYYSNVLSTISKIVAEVGDKVSKGTDIFYGTGGE